jgi:MYXO-CTERM domain-containing protein
LAALVVVSGASAQTLTKAAGTTALNLAGSWVENSAPTSASTLLFSSNWTTPAAVAMGANLDVNGIQVGTLANTTARITGTTGQTLTLGSGGINMSSATNNLRIDPAIVLSANQTWSVASGRILNLVAAGMSGPFTARVTGAGSLAFDASGTATYGSQLEVDSTILRVNFTSSDVTFTNVNNSFTTLSLFNGTARFSSIANSGSDSAAGAFATASLGGNATNGVFVYTGTTASTNRAFAVDRRSLASAILVSMAGETLTISGNVTHVGTNVAVADNGFRVGGAGNLILSGVVSNNTTVGFNTRLAKEGTGALTLSNANTFAGGVTVSAGSLFVENTTGSGTGSGAVTVQSGAVLGGNGSIGGSVTFNAGSKFAFSTTSVLDVNGASVSFGGFSISDLSGLTGSVDVGTYTLIAGSASISATNLANVGSANAFSLSAEKNAYFDLGTGDLQLVVASAIPEPAAYSAVLGLGVVALAAARRRRSSV